MLITRDKDSLSKPNRVQAHYLDRADAEAQYADSNTPYADSNVQYADSFVDAFAQHAQSYAQFSFVIHSMPTQMLSMLTVLSCNVLFADSDLQQADSFLSQLNADAQYAGTYVNICRLVCIGCHLGLTDDQFNCAVYRIKYLSCLLNCV